MKKQERRSPLSSCDKVSLSPAGEFKFSREGVTIIHDWSPCRILRLPPGISPAPEPGGDATEPDGEPEAERR